MLTTTQRMLHDCDCDVAAMRAAETFIHNNPQATYKQIMRHISPILDRSFDMSMWIVDWVLFCMELSKAGKLRGLINLNPDLLKPAQPLLSLEW